MANDLERNAFNANYFGWNVVLRPALIMEKRSSNNEKLNLLCDFISFDVFSAWRNAEEN